MGIEAGTRHDIGITHREVLLWSRSKKRIKAWEQARKGRHQG